LVFCLALGIVSACGGGGGSSASGAQAPDTGDVDPSTGDPPPNTGGSDGGPLNVATAAETAAYYTDLLPDVAAGAVTGGLTELSMLPVSGLVTYDGYMQLIMGNAVVSANVVGDASLQVNLSDQAILGQATGFLGVAKDEAGFSHVAHYGGVIQVSGGNISIEDDAISFDIAGELDNGLNTFGVDGTLVGGLYGADAEGLYAIGSYTRVHGDIETAIDGSAGPDNIGIAVVSTLKQ